MLKTMNQVIVLLNDGNVNVYDADTLMIVMTYAFPNGGHANCINFAFDYSFYMLAGKDPNMNHMVHFYNSTTHNLLFSLPTLFYSSSEIIKIVSYAYSHLFVISDQSTAPFTI